MKVSAKAVQQGGFTLVEIMFVGAIIGVLAGMALPALARARESSIRTTCINNLRQIESAKSQWALEFKAGGAAIPNDTDLFGPGLYQRLKPACPASGNYLLQSVSLPPTCDQPAHVLD
jgi:prepilin-type N-terminal cleavage/methylation domain-containing protein